MHTFIVVIGQTRAGGLVPIETKGQALFPLGLSSYIIKEVMGGGEEPRLVLGKRLPPPPAWVGCETGVSKGRIGVRGQISWEDILNFKISANFS